MVFCLQKLTFARSFRPLYRLTASLHSTSSRLSGSSIMASDECCKAGLPVTIEHEDKGKEIQLGDMDAYVSGDPAKAKAGILLFYDIFGLKHNQVREVCDRFAQRGYYVVMPDIFRKQPWKLEEFPPKDRDALHAFFGRINEAAPGDVETVKQHFKEVGLGDKKLGVIGFCWGGKWAMTVCADPAFGAGLAAHPAMLDMDMAKKVQCPMVLCPAQGDVECEPFLHEFKKHPWGDKCKVQRFDNQIHGFCAARGDWSQREVASAVEQVLALGFELFDATIGQ
eukprot:m.17225 g.17225  ORF g.17225 m.17225 type:complete len:281 (-) comp8239_c1_seq1:249-1091(-)